MAAWAPQGVIERGKMLGAKAEGVYVDPIEAGAAILAREVYAERFGGLVRPHPLEAEGDFVAVEPAGNESACFGLSDSAANCSG